MGRRLRIMTQWLRIGLACATLSVFAVPWSAPRVWTDSVEQHLRPPRGASVRTACTHSNPATWVAPVAWPAPFFSTDHSRGIAAQHRIYLRNCTILG